MTAPAAPDPEASAPRPAEEPSDAYRRYALGLLLVVYIFNFIDRQILNILAEEIRRDLDLSDTQLGFLGGLAFAIFYTFAGIPIARGADRGVRRSIIALGLFVWSAMTAVTGLTRSFLEIALARVGVGLGEAACSPPAHSLLSDLFPAERRATALGIYALGIPIGSAIGTFAGGWLKEFFDWRTAFFVVGLPGVLLAVVVRLTLREPPRGGVAAPSAPPAAMPSLRSVIERMASLASFRHMSFAAALHAFYGYGIGLFLPVYFIRVHGFSEGELGTYLALIGLIGGGLGTFLGGWIGDRLAPRDPRWYLWLPAIGTLLAVPLGFGVYLSPDGHVALAFALPASFLGSMYLGPSFAVAQGLARPEMRALVAAILLFVMNLIGLGLGPQAVGWLSDLLRPEYGQLSVRYALLWVATGGALWSALHYFWAARSFRDDLVRAQAPPS
ncbi:MAG: MFS transporter [Myxococcota bacterium]